MTQLQWYWHRLRAMTPGEMARHARKKVRQASDARRDRDWASVPLKTSPTFPQLPPPAGAPEELRRRLAQAAEAILAGQWRAFGQLALPVDDPPRWHRDYLAGVDCDTQVVAFRLNHRALPGGADIKLIWELSRWYALARLAQTAYVLGDARAGEKCLLWLEDWVKHNPPFRGWNWTSALEAGMRLIQFAWIDALLAPVAGHHGFEAELDTLRYEILPAHAWYAWRHQSFGSSANNHLLGELAGLIVATVRWPALAAWGASLDALQSGWEREVLAQFAPDGGNREQALNYQLFSWEFCGQALAALQSTGRRIAPEVEERLRRAARFFVAAQVPSDPWDYGDSDNALVSPLVAAEDQAVAEWHQWFCQPERSPALQYWWQAHGEKLAAAEAVPPRGDSVWIRYPESGQAIGRTGDWVWRLDVSPLGYLRTAAHGHLDALHLSLWKNGVGLIVDPGTGAYFANPLLRCWLASRQAHNGPCPAGEEWPRRLGPFLWAEPHEPPVCEPTGDDDGLRAALQLPGVNLKRSVRPLPDGAGCEVRDDWGGPERVPFTVRWQFAPETTVERLGARRFRVTRRGVTIEVRLSADWAEVAGVLEPAAVHDVDGAFPLAGTVSRVFRQTQWAPYLKLTAHPAGDKSCVLGTTFLASAPR